MYEKEEEDLEFALLDRRPRSCAEAPVKTDNCSLSTGAFDDAMSSIKCYSTSVF